MVAFAFVAGQGGAPTFTDQPRAAPGDRALAVHVAGAGDDQCEGGQDGHEKAEDGQR